MMTVAITTATVIIDDNSQDVEGVIIGGTTSSSSTTSSCTGCGCGFNIGDLKLSNNTINTACWKVANGTDGTINMTTLTGYRVVTTEGGSNTAYNESIIEFHNDGENGYWTVNGYNIVQNFTLGTTGTNVTSNITSIGVFGYETSAGSTVRVRIGTTSCAQDIGNGTKTNMLDTSYQWENITITTFKNITAGKMYYICMDVLSGGYRWANEDSGATQYAGGNVERVPTQWVTSDALFYVYGINVIAYADSGTPITTLTAEKVYYKMCVCSGGIL